MLESDRNVDTDARRRVVELREFGEGLEYTRCPLVRTQFDGYPASRAAVYTYDVWIRVAGLCDRHYLATPNPTGQLTPVPPMPQ